MGQPYRVVRESPAVLSSEGRIHAAAVIRSAQALETALESVAKARARVLILDITGVSAQVAMTLAGLGVDLGTMTLGGRSSAGSRTRSRR